MNGCVHWLSAKCVVGGPYQILLDKFILICDGSAEYSACSRSSSSKRLLIYLLKSFILKYIFLYEKCR
jgi:hypothetical protein